MAHLPLLLAASLLALALAGCSSAPSATLEQSGLTLASGKDSKTVDCSSGKGSVDYDVSGTMGKIKISIKDKNDGQVYGKDDVSGSSQGNSHDLAGAPGDWTLTVDRSGFSGSYHVTLKC